VARLICHEWALVSGTFDWGVLIEKQTHPNTDIERSKWDFGLISVIPCHNSIGAVANVRRKRESKVKLLSVPKRTDGTQRRIVPLSVSAP
jgi:hypothetical protein